MNILDTLKKYGIDSEQQLVEVLKDLNQRDKVQLVQALSAASGYTFQKYEPQSYQKKLHLHPAYIRALIAGNRTGKTWGCLHDLLWGLTGIYPDWFPEELKRETPFYARWIATDFKHGIGEVFMPAFKQMVPGPYKDGPFIKKVTKTQQGVWTNVEFQTGSKLSLMTNQQDVEEFEGWSGHRLDIDEPCSYAKYIASARGLIDYDGRICFHLTPLAEPWIYDEIFTKADNKKIFVVQASIRDNKYNTKEAVDKFEAQMDSDPDLKEARMDGKFRHLQGLVYKGLDRDVHMVDDFPRPFNWPVIHVVDPHDRKPHTHIWATVDPQNRYFIIGTMEQHGTVLETTHAIKKFERENSLNVVLRIGDPNKFKAPAAVGQAGSLKSAFAAYGIYFYTNVSDKIADGHSAVKQKLYWNKKLPRRLGNQPALYFVKGKADQCFNEMLKYVYYEAKDRDSTGIKEKPKEAHKDFPDTIRYLVMANPSFEPVEHNQMPDAPTSSDNNTGW